MNQTHTLLDFCA